MSESLMAVNDIGLNVLDEGEGPPVVLCHGFPELAFRGAGRSRRWLRRATECLRRTCAP
jgi:pimeloyl-ACP methyl ester carboxylesterase